MTGTNANTGKHISGAEHLKQSIRDILTTPLGARVMRRDYGSRLFDLVDRPMTQALLVELYAAVAAALDKWEPRFELQKSSVESIIEGKITLTLEGKFLAGGSQIKLEGITI